MGASGEMSYINFATVQQSQCRINVKFLEGTGKGADGSCLLSEFLTTKIPNNPLRVPTPVLDIFTSLTNPDLLCSTYHSAQHSRERSEILV